MRNWLYITIKAFASEYARAFGNKKQQALRELSAGLIKYFDENKDAYYRKYRHSIHREAIQKAFRELEVL